MGTHRGLGLWRGLSLFGGLGLGALVLASGCSSDDAAQESSFKPFSYAAMGPLSGDSGKGSFRFGAASADAQIEDQNANTDWWVWTTPVDQGGLGKGKDPVGEATQGYTRAIDDIKLLTDMHLDSYRFSMSWARIEPQRDQIDEAALEHYSQELDALIAAGIRPNVTIHHFSYPVWIDDPRDPDCAAGPSDTNLCGLGHPQGGPLVIQEMRQFAKLLAERFGDRVDDWATVNEPVNYLLAGHGVGQFPPGKAKLFTLLDGFMPVVRDYLSGHAAMYHAVKEADTIDADGDGIAANVGLTLSVGEWAPARDNEPSQDPEDVSAAERLKYVYHYMVPDAMLTGKFDADLDGTAEEDQPDWKGTLDWMGVQYYFRAGVTGKNGLVPEPLKLTPCFSAFDFGSCLLPTDPTWCVPEMQYEYYPEGLYNVLHAYGERYPELPLVVSESGIATEVGERRASNIVRALEQIERARAEKVDIRGYYYWSLTDNFEWVEGFGPRFGLYSVDYDTYERTPTLGAEVLGQIAETRKLSQEYRDLYGGTGPMTPEGTFGPRTLCSGKDLP
ncbi:MAG: family 1 glycosylhydrolase [Polyangiaceae bacterium]